MDQMNAKSVGVNLVQTVAVLWRGLVSVFLFSL
jgi:hypothetical protein